jgi:hypothetical protein
VSVLNHFIDAISIGVIGRTIRAFAPTTRPVESRTWIGARRNHGHTMLRGVLWRHLGASGGAFVDEFPGAAGIDFNCSMR